MGRFLTPAWLLRHIGAVVLTAGFLGLGWWQWSRAQEGNTISWGYTFQWPLFALFVAALWVREIRMERKAGAGLADVDEDPVASPFHRASDAAATGDEATDAYNRYLSWLSANPHRRPGEYPG